MPFGTHRVERVKKDIAIKDFDCASLGCVGAFEDLADFFNGTTLKVLVDS